MNDSPSESSEPGSAPVLRHIFTDAFRYWERRRIVYNLVLAVIVVVMVASHWSKIAGLFRITDFLLLFVLAVIANFWYCAAYVADIPLQYSELRETWRRWRWVLWLVGTLFAMTLAFFMLENGILPGIAGRMP